MELEINLVGQDPKTQVVQVLVGGVIVWTGSRAEWSLATSRPSRRPILRLA